MNKTRIGQATIHFNIRRLLKGRKRGLRCFEIRNLYILRYKHRYSESGFSARLREMRDVRCNLTNYTYKLV
jgi:hypothetical protein